MLDDFLALRSRICSLPRAYIPPRPSDFAVRGKCRHNVKYLVENVGGTFVYGWALADLGPIPVSGSTLPSLYSRWVSHVVWRDDENRLWEVTPRSDVFQSGNAWQPTLFVPDDAAQFEPAPCENCYTLPAMYIAVRPEVEWTADCLCQAERAPASSQDQWLNRALDSLRSAGLAPVKWQVQRLNDKISDAWLFANIAN